MQNFECALKMSFMMRWNSDGAFFSRKGMTFHSYWLKGTIKAVFYLSFGSIWICQKPDFISNLENMNAECNFCNKSFLLGIGYLIHLRAVFRGSCPNPAHLDRYLLPFPLEMIMKMIVFVFYHLSSDIK